MEQPAHFPDLFIGSVYNGHQRWHGDHGRFIKKDLAMEMIGYYLTHGLSDEQLSGMAVAKPEPDAAPPRARTTIFERMDAAAEDIRRKFLGEKLAETAMGQLVDLDEQRRRRRGGGSDEPTSMPMAVGAEWMPSSLFVVGGMATGTGGDTTPRASASLRGTRRGKSTLGVPSTRVPSTSVPSISVPSTSVPSGATTPTGPSTRRTTGAPPPGSTPPPVAGSPERHRGRRLLAILGLGAVAAVGLFFGGRALHDESDKGSAPTETTVPVTEPQGPAAPVSTEAPEPEVTVPSVIEEAGDDAEDAAGEAADDIEDAVDEAVDDGDDEAEEPTSEPDIAPPPTLDQTEEDEEPVSSVPDVVTPPVLDQNVPPTEPAAEATPGPVAEISPELAPAQRISPPISEMEPVSPAEPEAPTEVVPAVVGEPVAISVDAWPLANAARLGVEKPYGFVQEVLDAYNAREGRRFVWHHNDGMFWEGGHIIDPAELRVYNTIMAELYEDGQAA